MPETVSQDTDKKLVGTKESSATYGDKYLFDIFPINQPYSGAWVIITPISSGPKQVRFLSTPAVNQLKSHEEFISDWPERKDPFTQGDLLDSEEDQVQELIFRIKTSPSIPYRERLAKKLVTLFKDAKEEDSASPGIAVGSLRNFYNFLRLHANIKCPTISLTPEYNIYASWRVEQNRVFSVHYLPNGNVRFVIFKPNDRHPERQIRISGIATTDILMETVTPTGVWDWVSE